MVRYFEVVVYIASYVVGVCSEELKHIIVIIVIIIIIIIIIIIVIV